MYLIMVNHLEKPMSMVKCIGVMANSDGSNKEEFRCRCGHLIGLLPNTPNGLRHSRSRATTPISHDHFFHSTLGCIGIHSEAVDEHLSLCTQGSFSKRKEIPVDNSEQLKLSTGND